jgi:diacylglycerol kinase family enzyme
VAAHRVDGLKGVSFIRTTGACVSCSASRRVYVQADGELTGHVPARIELVPDALTLLIPEAYLRKHHR